MVTYEVNITLERAIEADYRAWLVAHVSEILSLPGFIGAQIFDVEPAETSASNSIQICVHYRLSSRAALAEYLAQHAPRLRADGVARFGSRFQATRRILYCSSAASENLLGTSP
jgi:Domain of unknown function (DUF4286)